MIMTIKGVTIKKGDYVRIRGEFSFDPVIGVVMGFGSNRKKGIWPIVKPLKYFGKTGKRGLSRNNEHVFGPNGKKEWNYFKYFLKEIKKVPRSEYQIIKLIE